MKTTNVIIGILAVALLFVGIRAYGKNDGPTMVPGDPNLDNQKNRDKCNLDLKAAQRVASTDADTDGGPGVIKMICPYTLTTIIIKNGSASDSGMGLFGRTQYDISKLISRGWRRA